MTVRIETERLVLRPLTQADVDDVTSYQSIEACVRYVPFNVRSRDEVAAAIERQQPADQLGGAGDFFVLGMELKATGQVIGQLNLGWELDRPKTASFGYLTHRDYWRHGYTREGITALLDYAIDVEQVQRLTAVIVIENDASIAFAESLGMRREATHIESIEEADGTIISTHVYALLAREWHALRDQRAEAAAGQ